MIVSLVILMISEVGSRIYIARISDFDFLSVSFDFLYEITLSAIDIDNIGSLEPLIPP